MHFYLVFRQLKNYLVKSKIISYKINCLIHIPVSMFCSCMQDKSIYLNNIMVEINIKYIMLSNLRNISV